MGKKLSLIERLDTALATTSSDIEKSHVYALFSNTAFKAIDSEIENFYSNILTYQSLIPEEGKSYSNEDIELGLKLQKTLRDSVILPERNNQRGFGRKYEKARKIEFDKILDFYN